MGLRDTMNRLADEQRDRAAATQAGAASVVGTCPNPAEHYDTEVNKGSVNMGALRTHLGTRYRQGYRLAHVYEQHDNTVLIYEHHFH